MEKNDLANDKIGVLLFRLALPSITAQLVNMLYNIVDRMYIGHIEGIGATALTGVGVTFPIIMIISAFSALIGMGGAPRVSICMGRKDKEGAEKVLGNCLTMLVTISVILTVFFLIFKNEILMAFGASSETLPYAERYLTIYICGTIFVQISLGMNMFISAQGFAKVSMATVLIGAIINIVLDPVFIFLFLSLIHISLAKTHKARDYILDEIMLKEISAPRPELSKYAPKMLSTVIPVDKIREVIGSGGKVIQKICAECDVKVDVEEDGHVYVSGIDMDNCKRAMTIIDTIVNDPEPGAIYHGKVTRLMDFGAFVEIAPGKEGLVHISRLDVKRTEKVTDVVNVGDEVIVKVLEIDDKGRLNLSRRDALIELEGLVPENEISDGSRGGRSPRRDDRRGGNGFRPNSNKPRTQKNDN